MQHENVLDDIGNVLQTFFLIFKQLFHEEIKKILMSAILRVQNTIIMFYSLGVPF